jgi:hypothetical protein
MVTLRNEDGLLFVCVFKHQIDLVSIFELLQQGKGIIFTLGAFVWNKVCRHFERRYSTEQQHFDFTNLSNSCQLLILTFEWLNSDSIEIQEIKFGFELLVTCGAWQHWQLQPVVETGILLVLLVGFYTSLWVSHEETV